MNRGRQLIEARRKLQASLVNPVSGWCSIGKITGAQATASESDASLAGPPATIVTKGSRISLKALAVAFCETIKQRGELTTIDFARECKITKRRRVYDVTNVLVALNLISLKNVGSRVYQWNDREGMIQMCRDTHLLNTDELIVDMFESKAQYPLQQTATCLINFYLCGHFKMTGETKKEKAALIETIRARVKSRGLASKNAKGHIVDSKTHNAYRRVYDVLNVFEAAGFYSCADTLLANGGLGPRPPSVVFFSSSSSASLEAVIGDQVPFKTKNGKSRLSYIKKEEHAAISSMAMAARHGKSKRAAVLPTNKRIRTRSSTKASAGDEEVFEDTLSQSPLSLKKPRRRNDEMAISAAASAQEKAEAGVPQEWISMGSSSSSLDRYPDTRREGNDALMEVLYTSHSDHFEYLPLLNDEVLFGGGVTMHMRPDVIF